MGSTDNINSLEKSGAQTLKRHFQKGDSESNWFFRIQTFSRHYADDRGKKGRTRFPVAKLSTTNVQLK